MEIYMLEKLPILYVGNDFLEIYMLETISWKSICWIKKPFLYVETNLLNTIHRIFSLAF